MTAPNRASEVGIIANAHAELFNHGKDANGTIVDVDAYEAGRRELTARIATELNREDGGRWGMLQKTDQGNKIPSDVLMWLETMEGFDVLAGNPDRAAWQPFGVNSNPAWIWIPPSVVWSSPGEPPVPVPTPAPLPPASDEVREFLELALRGVEVAERVADALEAMTVELHRTNTEGLKLRLR